MGLVLRVVLKSREPHGLSGGHSHLLAVCEPKFVLCTADVALFLFVSSISLRGVK